MFDCTEKEDFEMNILSNQKNHEIETGECYIKWGKLQNTVIIKANKNQVMAKLDLVSSNQHAHNSTASNIIPRCISRKIH